MNSGRDTAPSGLGRRGIDPVTAPDLRSALETPDIQHGSSPPRLPTAAPKRRGLKISLILASGVIPCVLVILLSAIATFKKTPSYAGEVLLQVDVTSEVVRDDPNFIETEMRIFGSEKVLNSVIRYLGLADRWEKGRNGPNVPQRLKRSIEVEHHPATNRISLKVHSYDPEEAALVANRTAKAYIQNRRDRFNRKHPISDVAPAEIMNAREAKFLAFFPVSVVKEATPNKQPALPNVRSELFDATVRGLFVGLIVILMVSGLVWLGVATNRR